MTLRKEPGSCLEFLLIAKNDTYLKDSISPSLHDGGSIDFSLCSVDMNGSLSELNKEFEQIQNLENDFLKVFDAALSTHDKQCTDNVPEESGVSDEDNYINEAVEEIDGGCKSSLKRVKGNPKAKHPMLLPCKKIYVHENAQQSFPMKDKEKSMTSTGIKMPHREGNF